MQKVVDIDDVTCCDLGYKVLSNDIGVSCGEEKSDKFEATLQLLAHVEAFEEVKLAQLSRPISKLKAQVERPRVRLDPSFLVAHNVIKDNPLFNQGSRKSKKVRVRNFINVKNLGEIRPSYFSILRRKVFVLGSTIGQAPNSVPSILESTELTVTTSNTVSKSSEVQF